VFLTGQTGFKGAWLALWLQSLGAQVRGFALPAEPGGLALAAGPVGESLHGDIRDPAALAAALLPFQPEVVLHLAAQALVRRGYREPVATFETNVMGSIHLLEAVRPCPSVRVVVMVTTDKCYANQERPEPYREDEALGGRDPYSASKAAMEIAVAAWRASFLAAGGVAVATARAGNVIGGGDWAADRLVPDCMRAITAGQSIAVRNPAATRPWQHVLEPLSGYLLLAEALWRDGAGMAEAWNFGPALRDVQPVGQVVETVARLWGKGAARHVEASPGAVHEAGLLAVDAAKARARLGWHPRLPLAQALEWTVEWYRRQADGEEVRALVLADIARYAALGKAYP
jgi:CDP-glucose 4,6-dehydratase